MSLRTGVSYDEHNDCVRGVEDYGLSIRKTRKVANQDLVMMLRGISAKWKQPIA
jgi:hypothetical protein